MNGNSIESKMMQRLNWHLAREADVKIAWFNDDGEIDLNEALWALPPSDLSAANHFEGLEDARHFALRRTFQRCFLKSAFNFQGPLSELPLRQERDSPPRCELPPETSLSFSSSGTMAIAAISATTKIGIDVEYLRPVPNALELAKRFFDQREAAYLESLAPLDCDAEFLKLWSIKEACLKAAGKGVVYGPEKFVIDPRYRIEPPAEFGTFAHWQLEFPEFSAEHFVAMAVYMPR